MRSLITVLLSTVLVLSFFSSSVSLADDSQKTVRVGWFESAFNITGENGRRSGYAYEYQLKIAAYTGWEYEYVEGSWSELFQMLENGEIDLLADVSYTEERAETLLFPTIPMGQEFYYLYTSSDNKEIRSDDLSTLNGKRIGVPKDSILADLYIEWTDQHGVSAQLVELSGSESDSLDMIVNGDLDGFVSMDSFGDVDYLTPLTSVGSSEFYFAVNGSRPDLLSDLDAALSAIMEEDRYYSQHLYDKYQNNSGVERYLSTSELEWLEEHGTIRIGYQDNYLAFCASDPATGELTGALKDYLEYASNGVINAQIEFEAISFPTASDAMTALQNGEVDCVFPANLTAYDSESMGVVMSPTLMSTEMLAVVSESDQQAFFQKDQITVAVNEGNPNYDLFLAEQFPAWDPVHYVDTPTCLKAVSEGKADCILISNYRYGNISALCDKYKLTTVSTGIDMDYCFAIKEGNTVLYSIMSKVTATVPDSVAHSALNYYASEDAKITFSEFMRDNLGIIMSVVSVILLIILILAFRNIRLLRKTSQGKKQIKNLSQRANYDALTSVRNKGAFTDYIENVQSRIDNGETADVAICIFDCNNLKQINDEYGHDKGDEYIKNACHFICTTFRRSAVFRIGGDEFAAVLMNEDFLNRDNLINIFNNEQEAISAAATDTWNRLHIAAGMAVYSSYTDSSLSDTIKRADDLMYERKRTWKESNS
ncbi:MAG: transporter substrate-binding domain-containing protein [Saccharofermentans sp.]|nr:transporter substrate-binding domain-containing protein [Saccharofermentans sp.]